MLIHIHMQIHIQLHNITQTYTSEGTRWWKINMDNKKTESPEVLKIDMKQHHTVPFPLCKFNSKET